MEKLINRAHGRGSEQLEWRKRENGHAHLDTKDKLCCKTMACEKIFKVFTLLITCTLAAGSGWSPQSHLSVQPNFAFALFTNSLQLRGGALGRPVFDDSECHAAHVGSSHCSIVHLFHVRMLG